MREVLWSSPESSIIASAQATILYNEFENDIFKIIATSPVGQWVNYFGARYHPSFIASFANKACASKSHANGPFY